MVDLFTPTPHFIEISENFSRQLGLGLMLNASILQPFCRRWARSFTGLENAALFRKPSLVAVAVGGRGGFVKRVL